jgi:LmbE family N-acetylglucosaminyl deacetylase
MRVSSSAAALDAPHWEGNVAVVSPHLDDAVLSVGASMRAAARRGASVTVVTVRAGDPTSQTPADASNRAMGFATAGAAAVARRSEDLRACSVLGVQPVWLDFPDDRNEEAPPPGELAHALREELAGYDVVLIPGFPLVHPDHLAVSQMVLENLRPERALGLYVEQPYATWNAMARSRGPRRTRAAGQATLALRVSPAPRWHRSGARPDDWLAKLRAVGEYRSQLRVLRRLPRLRIFVYEAVRGGESVMWCKLAGAS